MIHSKVRICLVLKVLVEGSDRISVVGDGTISEAYDYSGYTYNFYKTILTVIL